MSATPERGPKTRLFSVCRRRLAAVHQDTVRERRSSIPGPILSGRDDARNYTNGLSGLLFRAWRLPPDRVGMAAEGLSRISPGKQRNAHSGGDNIMANMGDLLWSPSDEMVSKANVTQFIAWLRARGDKFESYEELRRWSVADIAGFWEAVWRYFEVTSSEPYECVLRNEDMPGAEWFPGARVNYIRTLLSKGSGDKTAIYAAGEEGAARKISWDELKAQVFKVATALRELGIGPGDRVVSYMPNVPEAAVAFFATASIGAVWSSCSPDFGSASVIDRFGQITPKLLFATDSYRYGGKVFDRREEVRAMADALPSLQHVVHVPGADPDYAGEPVTPNAIAWAKLMARPAVSEAKFVFEDTRFDHPLWIVYSSGTTGLPKPFVHGHGGVLLEALKFTHFHLNLTPSSCMFYFTTAGCSTSPSPSS